jgi:acyl-CoA dehydrogenase-like protein
MRTCPSDIAVDAATGLSDFLAGKIGKQPAPDQVEADRHDLWDELRAGGWLDVGTELAAESSDETQLVLDAVCLAGAFSKYLISLPFVEELAGQVSAGLSGRDEITVAGAVPVAFPTERFGAAGVAVGAVDTFAPSLPTGQARLGVVDVGRLRVEATLRAMGAVSCARTAFTGAVDYSRGRRAYGQVIGSFQAMKHLMADMFVALELAESGCVWAANDLADTFTICDDVLARCLWVTGRCIQVYGGIGFTWEGGTHYYVRHIVAARRLNRDIARLVGQPIPA